VHPERTPCELMQEIVVRPERLEDRAAVFEINRRAFPTEDEARLVDAVRLAAKPMISLVAVAGEAVVGHILLTPVAVYSKIRMFKAMGLGPMAVMPEFQMQGVGSKLVRAGLQACREIGEAVVFVLGHPEYYPRFGFEPAPPKLLRFKGPEFDPYFMVAELVPGVLKEMTGHVEYLSEFGGM
jgi:putative acetyltransferase